MTRRAHILLATHFLAAGVGYGVVWQTSHPTDPDSASLPEYTKLAQRGAQTATGDGDKLLADFIDRQSGKNSKYQELKATLPVAKDLRGAVISAVEGLGGADWKTGLTEDEQADRLAEVEVRVWHWMKQNPVAAMGFVINDAACAEVDLPALLNRHVFREIVSESGVLKSVGWLARSEAAFPTLCAVALDEIRAGGGLGLFAKLDDAISKSPKSGEFLEYRSRPLALGNPAYDGERFLRWVGGSVRFDDREKLLATVKSQASADDGVELLAGFARSSGPAAEWVLGELRKGEILKLVPKEMQPELREAVLEVAALDLGQRLELLRTDPDFEEKPRQELVNELIGSDVLRLLEDGRDWRFEFRYGTASAAEILKAVKAGLPPLTAETDEIARVTLYRQLAEENPKMALPLLDDFPPDKRREILLNSTWLSHTNVSPDDFLRFLADVPDAQTPQEQELKIKGWNWKARGNLWRYGDDYIEWVMKMPGGIHKEAAMNSIVWATAEQNPGAARLVSEKFYPR